MLPILILLASFWQSDALVNDIAIAAKNQLLAENVIPPYLNYKGYPHNDQDAAISHNAADCPNTSILLNILKILTNKLSKDDKTNLEPEKFKYVLKSIKNFLETLPTNPENVKMYNIFKNLEVQLNTITGPKEKRDLRERDKPDAKNALRNDIPVQGFTNCRDMLNVLINFFNTVYSQVLRYCSTTEKCYDNNENKTPNINNGLYRFNSNEPTPTITTSNWPVHGSLRKESLTAGSDLVNFIRSQEGKGVNNIISILQNYRPSGASGGPSDVPGNKLKITNPNVIQNPLLQVNPGSFQVPNLYPPINEINGKITESQNPLNSNINTEPWQSTYYKFKGLPPGNPFGYTNESNQFSKLVTEQFYQQNNVGVSGPNYNGVYSPLNTVNPPIDPIKTGVLNGDLNEMFKPSITPDKNQKLVLDFINQNPNQQQNLLNSYMKMSQTQIFNPINKVQSYDMNSLLNMPQNYLYPNKLPQNIQLQKPVFQGSFLNQYPQQANQPNLQTNNYFPELLKQNDFSYNQIKFHNGHMFTDNANQQNNGQLSVNQLLSVANSGKLNTIPQKNDVVELTYVLKQPKPVYEPAYYVKYRMPYQTFLFNLQNMLAKKPNLRNDPTNLHQDLLIGSNVTDLSKDLKGLNYEDLLKLTSSKGTLITAKIVDANNTLVDRTLKIIQQLNSKLPAENIINYNINVTKNIRLDSQKEMNVSQNSTNVNNKLLNNVQNVQRRGVYQNYPYNSLGQYPSHLQPNPYYLYQPKPNILGTPFLNPAPPNHILKNPALFPSNTANMYPQLMKNPGLYPSNTANMYPQFGR
ncbi:uncharacterized protein LOC112046708 [Bicyclus anynana]|uniref:Uncharacterized protein LOC112046708 n=1 Tax=Bicyclus anynana TaxID=110368 RepID=A0A6J1N274_BICAN|nr:uncharacterized protein LOC112046708 [Bicyclus anynana]